MIYAGARKNMDKGRVMGLIMTKSERDIADLEKKHRLNLAIYRNAHSQACALLNKEITRLQSELAAEKEKVREAVEWIKYYGPEGIIDPWKSKNEILEHLKEKE